MYINIYILKQNIYIIYIHIYTLYTDACIYIYTHDMLPSTGNLQEWVLQRNIWEIVGNEPIWMPDQGLPIFSHRLASGFWSSSSLVEPLIMKYGINLGWAEILDVSLCFFFTLAVAIFVERISYRLAKFDRDNPSRCADALPFANVNDDFFIQVFCVPGDTSTAISNLCMFFPLDVIEASCCVGLYCCFSCSQPTIFRCRSLLEYISFCCLNIHWHVVPLSADVHLTEKPESFTPVPFRFVWQFCTPQFDAESSPPCQNGHQWAVYPMLSIHIQRSCCWIPCGELTSINIVIIYSYWPCQFIKGYIPMIFLLINYIPSWYRRIHAWCPWNAPGAKWLFFAGVGSIVLSAGMGSSGSWNGGTSGHFSSHIWTECSLKLRP